MLSSPSDTPQEFLYSVVRYHANRLKFIEEKGLTCLRDRMHAA